MKRLLLASSLVILFAGSLLADMAHNPIAEYDPTLEPPSGQSTLTGSCTIVYYNTCSGWKWIWSGFRRDDAIGVIFDLPNECGKATGEMCTNSGIWWYWRWTMPGRGCGLYTSMYEVDATGCLVGSPINPTIYLDPWERWNYTPGLGSTTADRVAIVAEWNNTAPYLATDHNVSNENAAGCGGLIGTGNTVRFVDHDGPTVYCPPVAFADDLGYVDLIMRASFTCETTANDEASWGEIKSLFQ